RAWRAPDLALTKPEVFYLQSSENKVLNLRVDSYTGAAVTASIAPDPPVVGNPANLFVLVSQRMVDAAGIVRSVPMVGVGVDLSGSGVQLESSNPATTDGNGVAEWRVRCMVAGASNLSVTTAGGSFPLSLSPFADY